MSETLKIALKRLRIRAWRRGTKEMDLILGGFVDSQGPKLDAENLRALEEMMEENDNDLYQWVSGQRPGPERHAAIIGQIQAFHGIANKLN
ncbi:MAG: succinate dehydrogenase assembly factor 2 [Pseudomonadota bacterium]